MNQKEKKNIASQKDLVINENWKFLIVLDACRYDYFEELCNLSGELNKVKSPAFKGDAAPTSVWYKVIFQDKYDDIIHISSHPRVNSKTRVEGFKASDHFFKIIDLWDSQWNEEIGTVLPENVTEKSIEVIRKFPDKRFIIHYMQPHTPYLSLGAPSTRKKKTPDSRESISRKIRNWTVKHVRNVIGDEQAVAIMDFLGIPPLSPMDDALRKVGEEGVKKAYRDNLSRVLDSVEELLKFIDGKCVISSDHGEVLGKGGRFGHDLDPRPELYEVPWFKIEQVEGDD